MLVSGCVRKIWKGCGGFILWKKREGGRKLERGSWKEEGCGLPSDDRNGTVD